MTKVLSQVAISLGLLIIGFVIAFAIRGSVGHLLAGIILIIGGLGSSAD
jgi:hypothetical protein